MPMLIEVDAPAKVNLRLKVLAQETTGYHSLESIFCAVSLADSLRLRRDGGDIRLSVDGGAEIGPVEENLVVRAARRFYLEMGGVEEGVHIELRKRIPAAAGLGGGSSDAAATLRALNALYDEPFPPERLLQMAIELGSDVPFFLCGSTLALGWSHGERLLALPPLSTRPVLIAHPGVAMPTSQAFQRIAELRGGRYQPTAFSLPAAGLSDWDAIAALAENDFDPVAVEQLPQLAGARQALLDAGAQIAMVAGSGAAIFGIFAAESGALDAESWVQELGFTTWIARTLEAMPALRSG